MRLLRKLLGLRSMRTTSAMLAWGTPVALSGMFLLQSSDSQPPVRVPTNVAWTQETIATASEGNALRGLVVARRCERCHGQEGFSNNPSVPNLAAMDKLSFWKQMIDFRDGKRQSPMMQPIAAVLAEQDYADLAAYYFMLPTYPDPQDPRVFPEQLPPSAHTGLAVRLISGGDGARGIPPCQACHGPLGRKNGAPSLGSQNSDYIEEELNSFARRRRANDMNMPMRSIAALLSENEKKALAAYYGAGMGEFQEAK